MSSTYLEKNTCSVTAVKIFGKHILKTLHTAQWDIWDNADEA